MTLTVLSGHPLPIVATLRVRHRKREEREEREGRERRERGKREGEREERGEIIGITAAL